MTIGRHEKRIALEGQSRRTTPALLLPLAGVAVVVVVGALVFFLRGSPAPPVQPTHQPQVAVQPTAKPTDVPPTATPACPSIASEVARITTHEQAGDWAKAADEAENGLSISGLCDADRKTLTRYAVFDGLKDVYTKPFKPLDKAQHQAMIDRYLALKQRARDAGVAIDTSLQVASTTFPSSQFPLARVALEEAYKDGSFKPEINRDLTRMYVSTLYGIGAWYTTADANDPLYMEGLRWLVTSHRIAVKYQTGQSEAAMLLSQLVSPEEAAGLEPFASPLL